MFLIEFKSEQKNIVAKVFWLILLSGNIKALFRTFVSISQMIWLLLTVTVVFIVVWGKEYQISNNEQPPTSRIQNTF